MSIEYVVVSWGGEDATKDTVFQKAVARLKVLGWREDVRAPYVTYVNRSLGGACMMRRGTEEPLLGGLEHVFKCQGFKIKPVRSVIIG